MKQTDLSKEIFKGTIDKIGEKNHLPYKRVYR